MLMMYKEMDGSPINLIVMGDQGRAMDTLTPDRIPGDIAVTFDVSAATASQKVFRSQQLQEFYGMLLKLPDGDTRKIAAAWGRSLDVRNVEDLLKDVTQQPAGQSGQPGQPVAPGGPQGQPAGMPAGLGGFAPQMNTAGQAPSPMVAPQVQGA
jgi:hypothetical protein